MKYLSTLFLFISICSGLHAQYDTIYMAIMPFTSSDSIVGKMIKTAETNAISAINKDYRILRVDRDVANAVEWEREYQKSEDFIDGKIVEQGKAIGANYVMEGYYDTSIKELTISIYDMSNGALKGSVVAEKSNNSTKQKRKGTLDLLTMRIAYDSPGKTPDLTPAEIQANVKKLLDKCFPRKGWAVIRPLKEKKNKIKELLIAAGSRMGLKRRTLIEIVAINTEEVDGVKIDRFESIGWGTVSRVEDGNFSILKIGAGQKNIKKYLDSGQKIRCRILRK